MDDFNTSNSLQKPTSSDRGAQELRQDKERSGRSENYYCCRNSAAGNFESELTPINIRDGCRSLQIHHQDNLKRPVGNNPRSDLSRKENIPKRHLGNLPKIAISVQVRFLYELHYICRKDTETPLIGPKVNRKIIEQAITTIGTSEIHLGGHSGI